jgi:hypothetical protein
MDLSNCLIFLAAVEGTVFVTPRSAWCGLRYCLSKITYIGSLLLLHCFEGIIVIGRNSFSYSFQAYEIAFFVDTNLGAPDFRNKSPSCVNSCKKYALFLQMADL